MTESYIPIALCSNEGLVGWLLIYVILFYQYAWFLLSGSLYISMRMWIAFLVMYGYLEARLFGWLLSREFVQSRPTCTLMADPIFDEKRKYGMPSIEVLQAFMLSTFIITNILITRQTIPRYTLFTITALPFLVAAAMWITHNNTISQVAVGVVFGFLNGLRLVGLYHAFLKTPLLTMISKLKFVRWFFPTLPTE
jgi:hypothetical protein